MGSSIMIDEWKSYIGIGEDFSGGHQVVKHGDGEFVRGNIFTKTVQSYFVLLTRGVMGIFHHVSKGHLIDIVISFHLDGIIGKLVMEKEWWPQ